MINSQFSYTGVRLLTYIKNLFTQTKICINAFITYADAVFEVFVDLRKKLNVAWQELAHQISI